MIWLSSTVNDPPLTEKAPPEAVARLSEMVLLVTRTVAPWDWTAPPAPPWLSVTVTWSSTSVTAAPLAARTPELDPPVIVRPETVVSAVASRTCPVALPSTVRWVAPGPLIVSGSVTVGSALASSIVPVTLEPNVIVSAPVEALASPIA